MYTFHGCQVKRGRRFRRFSFCQFIVKTARKKCTIKLRGVHYIGSQPLMRNHLIRSQEHANGLTCAAAQLDRVAPWCTIPLLNTLRETISRRERDGYISPVVLLYYWKFRGQRIMQNKADKLLRPIFIYIHTME